MFVGLCVCECLRVLVSATFSFLGSHGGSEGVNLASTVDSLQFSGVIHRACGGCVVGWVCGGVRVRVVSAVGCKGSQ